MRAFQAAVGITRRLHRSLATSPWAALRSINRSYPEACTTFGPGTIPLARDFNFAYDVIDARASEQRERPSYPSALVVVPPNGGPAREVCYASISEQSSQFAAALRRLGCVKGDAAIVITSKLPEWFGVLFGCFKLGVVAMPGTSLLTANDIAARVQQSGARVVAVSPEHVSKVEEIRSRCPTLAHLIVVRDAADASGEAEAAPPGWHEFAALCEPEPRHFDRADAEPTLASDTMMTYFTSGTTGPPKMVPRDFGYALAHCATAAFWMDLREGEVHWSLTDTGWAKAAWGILFPQMLAGATTVLYDPPSFDAAAVLGVIGQVNVNTFCAPPTAYRLFAQEDLSSFELSSLRRCLGAGEPLNPEVNHAATLT